MQCWMSIMQLFSFCFPTPFTHTHLHWWMWLQSKQTNKNPLNPFVLLLPESVINSSLHLWHAQSTRSRTSAPAYLSMKDCNAEKFSFWYCQAYISVEPSSLVTLAIGLFSCGFVLLSVKSSEVFFAYCSLFCHLPDPLPVFATVLYSPPPPPYFFWPE